MKHHTLKTWPVYFERVSSGQKTFEVRKNDRDFQAGDTLTLEYYDPNDKHITGISRSIYCQVEYVLHGGQFGIEPGYVVMSIKKVD